MKKRRLIQVSRVCVSSDDGPVRLVPAPEESAEARILRRRGEELARSRVMMLLRPNTRPDCCGCYARLGEGMREGHMAVSPMALHCFPDLLHNADQAARELLTHLSPLEQHNMVDWFRQAMRTTQEVVEAAHIQRIKHSLEEEKAWLAAKPKRVTQTAENGKARVMSREEITALF